MNEIRKEIIETVKKLSEYNLAVWKQVGPQVQAVLVDHLVKLSSAEIDAIRPLAITVWREALDSNLSGTTWKADSMTLHMGAVPASDLLREIREKAIHGLFGAFSRAKSDTDKSEIISALDTATRTPNQAEPSNELLKLTLCNAREIVEFYNTHAGNISFELLQHLEHQLLYDYRRAIPLADDPDHRFNVKEEAQSLKRSIESFRDTINQDNDFVRYKVLVGFESVYPGHWYAEDDDFEEEEAYRRVQADQFINTIAPGNEQHWFAFLDRCANTQSNDLATFPVFGDFLIKLSEVRPEFAQRLLRDGSSGLRTFMPAFLVGLSRSTRQDIYNSTLRMELEKGENLLGIARHLRNEQVRLPGLASQVLSKAIAIDDVIAVIEILTLNIERWGTVTISDEQALFEKAIGYLTAKEDARWVRATWFQSKTSLFFAELSRKNAELLLTNLLTLSAVDYQLERIFEHIAAVHLELVWNYFGDRLSHERLNPDGTRYEAIPYRFHGLEKQLSRDPELAVKKARGWYERESRLFRFGGGRLLSITFPTCSDAFARVLIDMVQRGTDADTNFVLDIMQNYHGEPSTHEILKAIAALYPNDEHKLSKVSISFDNMGVVSGEFGMVAAHRAKKVAMEAWLNDPRPQVVAFASKHIADLGLRIAYEQKRAEENSAMRRLDFEADNDETTK